MDISKKLYQGLTAKQRAIAAFSAINRDDQVEIDRLMENVPKDKNPRQAAVTLLHALHVYNQLSASETGRYLIVSSMLLASQSYCTAWLAAGGALDAQEYCDSADQVENLLPIIETLARNIEAIRQAAREWCVTNQIPPDFFSGPVCIYPIPTETTGEIDDKTLTLMRSMFDKITINW